MRIVRTFGRIGGLAVLASAVALSGCGSTAKLMGKSLPDETQVIDGPTLALPPQFDLRPPRQAADYETMLRAQKGAEARSLITTGTSTTTVEETETTTTTSDASATVPAADTWLVDKSNAQTGIVADPNVRSSLENKYPEDLKAAEDAKAKKGWLGRWFGGSDE